MQNDENQKHPGLFSRLILGSDIENQKHPGLFSRLILGPEPLPQRQRTATVRQAAQRIITAGRKRRGEILTTRPRGAAAAIINAGRKRRGEI